MDTTINYAEKWMPDIIASINQNCLCSPFVAPNVEWLGAKTFHFTQMNVSGYKNHNRNGGWNQGAVVQTDVPYTAEHDRDIELFIDRANVDESNETASMKNISDKFEEEQAAPELDSIFFSKTAQKALSITGAHSETALSEYTKENILAKLKAYIASNKLKLYRNKGVLIMYLATELMDLLSECPTFNRTINVVTIADGGVGIETRITDIDKVTIIEVIDDEVFYSKFNYESDEGGFIPASDAKAINVLIASPVTDKVVTTVNSIYMFGRGQHTKGDGYLYQNRSISDCFIFPNGKSGKIDSVYVDLRKAEA
ncbi:MAG: phage capsid protein [Clostridia bacterium]|nr:phage capsid protein [Clostridia bacterium]